ncbi:MAG: hypothetical protein IIA10_10175 [Proteobacteria bacterium]|nr:hypothetical protein [Pseudomonadota bacterium]
MLIRWLPLLAGLLPFLAGNVAYWMGVTHDVLPSCIPYIDGCTSISSTGRHPPGSLLFRAAHLPQGVLLIFLWYFSVQWLRALRPGVRKSTELVVLISGTIGGLALIVYTTYLGTTESFYEFMRRFGIYCYFLGTVLAQLFLALSFLRHARSQRSPALVRMARAMLWLCLTPFVLGILNLTFKALLADTGAIENRIEWIAAMSMQAYFVVLYYAWRATRIAFGVTAGPHY